MFCMKTYNKNQCLSNNIRKCVVTKEDLDITESIKANLKITEKEMNQLKDTNILYFQTRKKEDFEE